MTKATGGPGIEPKWSRGNKDGIGTAYSSSSQIWFTLLNGIITEIYYPTVDTPQIRDLQFLISDGASIFHEEKRQLLHKAEKIDRNGLAFLIKNSDPGGKYVITKEVISDPHAPVVLQHVRIEGDETFLSKMSLFVLCAPHIDVGGFGNNGRTISVGGKRILLAEKNGTYLAIAATVPFIKTSCGYVGVNDGWTDISTNFKMTQEFDSAENGNIALTGQIEIPESREFVLGISMGNSLHSAVTRLFQAIFMDFEENKNRFIEQWQRAMDHILPLDKQSQDGGSLYRSSYEVVLAHEDKTFEGALIASLSIPWGEVAGDNNKGGYHLVWTRDLYNSASAVLAVGNIDLPLRALIYLSVSQLEDGSFAQNFWIDGTPYWHGIQLDEASFPIILAWKLKEQGGLKDFNPLWMVWHAAKFIVTHGPATQQERWEEASGYSPSTLAANIAALICAASFLREAGDEDSATFLEEYADFLECHIESWTVTTIGTVCPGVSDHYIRIRPCDVTETSPEENPNTGTLHINNILPGDPSDFPARDIVDGGFLELVRYGIRKADNPLIADSVKVIDKVLKVKTPSGPAWHRYNHDGYGQRDDGTAYQGWGRGRLWPLLTGERGHYELSLGNTVEEYVQSIEKFASETGLIPEQVWDTDDLPDKHLYLGKETGSARPLVWAHAEYVKLLRSASDGRIFDRIDQVEERYITDRGKCKKFEIWKLNRRISVVERGFTLRIQAPDRFELHWSQDRWHTVVDSPSKMVEIGMYYVDFLPSEMSSDEIVFTFNWIDKVSWEGTDFKVHFKD